MLFAVSAQPLGFIQCHVFHTLLALS